MAKGKTPYTATIDWDSIAKELHDIFNDTVKTRKSVLSYRGVDNESTKEFSKVIVGAAQALAADSAEARAQREESGRKDFAIDKTQR